MKTISKRSDYTGFDRKCNFCQKVYNDIPKRRVLFCSKDCWKKSIDSSKKFTCAYCKKEYVARRTRNIKYCGRECWRKSMIGWIPPEGFGEKISKAKLKGREPSVLTRKIRKSAKYYKVRSQILERDNNECQICGELGNTWHHIYEASKYKERIFDIDNGITLCKWCHDKRVSQHEKEWVSYFEFNLQVRDKASI